MRILALDTSTEWCSVAVGDGREWHVCDEQAGQAHSERILPIVRATLAEAGIVLSQLDAIAFGAGPGSFTGVRSGCGAGNGYAAYPSLAAGLELAAVDANLRPAAQSIGELALPRLAAGEGVAAAHALPLYVRHRVALTTAEREAGARL